MSAVADCLGTQWFCYCTIVDVSTPRDVYNTVNDDLQGTEQRCSIFVKL